MIVFEAASVGGGWKHCGFLSLEILERMGFRIVAANGGATFGNPGKGAGFPVVEHFQWLSHFAEQSRVCHVCHLVK
jgi:hypothetical protein